MASPTGKDAKSWIDASRYDLETARALLESRRYLYVLFMCQQSLEKLLKAHVMARTVEFPPEDSQPCAPRRIGRAQPLRGGKRLP